MINWLDQNEFVWLGRMLTGYNLRFSSSSKTTNYVLPINYEENRYELVENFIWVPFKWPIFTVLLSFTQVSNFVVVLLQFKVFKMLIKILVVNILFLDGRKFRV